MSAVECVGHMIKTINFKSSDSIDIFAYKWDIVKPVAAVQIAHGAVEHAMRYDDFAHFLNEHGFVVLCE